MVLGREQLQGQRAIVVEGQNMVGRDIPTCECGGALLKQGPTARCRWHCDTCGFTTEWIDHRVRFWSVRHGVIGLFSSDERLRYLSRGLIRSWCGYYWTEARLYTFDAWWYVRQCLGLRRTQ